VNAPFQSIEFRPGVYFEMPEETYHAVPALSASGVKLLRASPLDYWVRSPFNPVQSDVLENDESEAKDIGSAYDCRITCGREIFLSKYVAALTPEDVPGALKTADDIRAALEAKGQKKSGNKPELIERLLSIDPTAKIFDVIMQGYGATHAGKKFLPQRLMDKIELAAAMIEKHPALGKAFSGGAAQVSIFWNDEETGVPCKARLDYLKPKAIVDLKTFSNPFKRPVSRAIDQAFANYRYFIQATHYLTGAKHVARLLREGKTDAVSLRAGTLAAALAQDHPKTFLFVFQATGPAPIARGRVFPETSSFFTIARDELNFHMRTYAECLERFGSDPWVDTSDIDAFDDANLPAWAAE
jgi:hypothetical protein